MKNFKYQFIALGILALSLCGVVSANSTSNPASIAFYSKPQAKKSSEMLDIHTSIVPIIRQDDWVKVGLQPSGKVGWIYIPQYKKALKAYYEPQSESFSVTVTRDKNGKPNTVIKAYRNGHLLPQEEAKKLYEHLQSQKNSTRLSVFDQPFFTRAIITPFDIINTQPGVQISLDSLPQLEPVQKPKSE